MSGYSDLRYPRQDPSLRYRGVIAVIGLHILLVWALVTGTARKTLELLKKPLQAVILQEVIIPLAPPLPSPPKTLLPPEPLAPKVTTPLSVVQPDAPMPAAARPMETLPEPAAPVAIKPLSLPALPTAPPPPAADTIPVASLEGDYVARVRAMLNSVKRYPTGRQASQQRPQGKVKVWFTLTRTGTLAESGVLESSNFNLLDDAALASVRRGIYPAFPEHTWPGQEQHKFSADIEFAPPSGG